MAFLGGIKVKEDKKLLNLLPKPLRQIVRIAVAVCGIDIVGVILALTAIVSKKDFFDQYYKFLISLLIFMISSLIIGLLLIAIALSIEILRIKPFKEDFDKNLVNCTGNCTMIQENVVNGLQCLEQIKKDESHIKDHVQTFTQHLDKLESVITGLDMAGRIINKRKLMEIEDSICPGAEIIILSSKYKLDEEYKSLIVNNIKKGVTYKYIVAGIKEPSGSHVHFLQTVDSWYQEYQSSLDNEKVPTATLKKTKRLNDPSYFEKKFYKAEYGIRWRTVLCCEYGSCVKCSVKKTVTVY